MSHVTSAGKFRTLVGTGRTTAEVGVVSVGGRTVSGKLQVAAAGVHGSQGAILLNDNLAPGAILLLGSYRLLFGTDVQVGTDESETAANLAAAINRFVGFSAEANEGSAVFVTADEPGYEIPFRLIVPPETDYDIVPTDGFLSVGSPYVGTPPAVMPDAGWGLG